MKLKVPISRSCRGATATPERGFTLPELMIAITVFTLLIGGVVFAHLYGLSMYKITETKLSATDHARRMLWRIADEIRTCKSTELGNISGGFFVSLMDGEKQESTGLKIFPTTNTANFIIYFVNPSDLTFRRTTSTPGTAIVLARSVTNTAVFRSQDYLGYVLTNNSNNRVIHLDLDFYQPKRHLQVADFYKLETSVTRRALE